MFSYLYLAFLRFYKKYISRRLSRYGHCRFHPTCSQYSRMAVERHGIVKGLRLTAARLRRCNPDNFDSIIDYPP